MVHSAPSAASRGFQGACSSRVRRRMLCAPGAKNSRLRWSARRGEARRECVSRREYVYVAEAEAETEPEPEPDLQCVAGRGPDIVSAGMVALVAKWVGGWQENRRDAKLWAGSTKAGLGSASCYYGGIALIWPWKPMRDRRRGAGGEEVACVCNVIDRGPKRHALPR